MTVRIESEVLIDDRVVWFVVAAEEGRNAHGKEVEEGDHMTGSFKWRSEAENYAKTKGWVIVE